MAGAKAAKPALNKAHHAARPSQSASAKAAKHTPCTAHLDMAASNRSFSAGFAQAKAVAAPASPALPVFFKKNPAFWPAQPPRRLMHVPLIKMGSPTPQALA
ncbi:MAG: hypothetical protein EAY75_01420 [Bacteroidetes bacterium]|nr:MAG: hypothetical protein EAY75_01420 [Bacteroidota bacterium]